MQYFITSTGTEVGKTFILQQICQRLIAKGQKVSAIKPVISGFCPEDFNSDLHKILQSLGKDPKAENFDDICLYKFKAPLSPNVAATLENKEISFAKISHFCQEKMLQARQNHQHFFVEGAGGVMSPISADKTFIDLVAALKIPVILVVGNYLGCISHTLTAIRAMQSHGINIAKIVLNIKKDDEISYEEGLETLQNFIDQKIVVGCDELLKLF